MKGILHPSFLVALVLLGLWSMGCAGQLENPESFLQGSVTSCGLTDVENELIIPRCAACHTANGVSGGLDLATPNIPPRLFGVAALCGGEILVDPAAPDTGFFYEKLLPGPGCGSVMPMGGTPLTASEMTCVKEWLTEAAGGI